MELKEALNTRLQKAKYLKRWRGKDGRYHYLYKQAKKKVRQEKEETEAQPKKRTEKFFDRDKLSKRAREILEDDIEQTANSSREEWRLIKEMYEALDSEYDSKEEIAAVTELYKEWNPWKKS